MLQPAFMKTGITSSLKLIGGSSLGVLHRHRQRDFEPGVFDVELGLAVGNRIERLLVKSDQRRVGQREFRLGRDVARDSVGVASLNDQRLPIAGRRQFDVRRKDEDLGRLWQRRGRRISGESEARR